MGELYASSAISNVALSVTALYEPIFLYAILGFSIPKILLFTAVVYAVYIVLIPFGGKFASVYGYRHCIALSVPFQIFYWLALLASIQNPNAAFLAAVIYGVQKAFYWPGFHSVIARYAQTEQVGREFGAAYAINSLAQIGGPLIGGIISQYFGVPFAFLLASVIYCASAIPLLMAKEIFIPKLYMYKDTLQLYKDYKKKFISYIGFGEELIFLTIWPIFIFIVVKDFKDTGMLAAAGSLVAGFLALFLGKISDKYTKHMLVKIGALFTTINWLGRIFVGNFIGAFSSDSIGKASKETWFIPLSTLTYLRAEKTHVIPYIIFFEQSLAIGKLSAALIGALLFSLTGSFMILFIVGAIYSLLYMLI